MFDISKLKNNVVSELPIDEEIKFSEDDLKTTEIKRLENIRVKGNIKRIDNNIYHLTINITGNMILLCARSLEEVSKPLDIFINRNYSEEVMEDEKQVIFQNSLDIFSIVWENIVLEVPIRVIKENADFLKSGDGWSLVMENKNINNSPFSDLLNMLDMEGKE